MDNWQQQLENSPEFGELILAGRFSQWKYYWTDDCLLRGLQIGRHYNAEQLTSIQTQQQHQNG